MWKHLTGAVAMLAGTACMAASLEPEAPGSSAGGACTRSAGENKRIVLAFYEEALMNLRPRAAFERYASSDFIEHKADVEAGTREATIRYLEALIASVPKPRWKVERTLAEDDLVFLHARFAPAEGALEYAIADIFRLRDCKLVEHWDVVAPPPETQRNPHPRF